MKNAWRLKMNSKLKTIIGWITGEHMIDGTKFGWKCTMCKIMNYFTVTEKWVTKDTTCSKCKAQHIVDIDSENIKY